MWLSHKPEITVGKVLASCQHRGLAEVLRMRDAGKTARRVHLERDSIAGAFITVALLLLAKVGDPRFGRSNCAFALGIPLLLPVPARQQLLCRTNCSGWFLQ